MTLVVYDGSFEGFLTVAFEVFEYKLTNIDIKNKQRYTTLLFGTYRTTITNDEKAARVWKGLSQKVSAGALGQIYKAFLSDERGMENTLVEYIQYVFANSRTIEYNYAHPAVLKVMQTARKVHREKHRMEAFIRFQLTLDQLYYAICQPDYNVLPLIEKHFKDRYANQRWLIYDSKRKYGIYYDMLKVETIKMAFSSEANNGRNIETICDEKEDLYQKLWQQYFTSVNIAARKNMKLHIQHMPKRYWKYLPEKQQFAK